MKRKMLRTLAFAGLMSLSTAMLVSATLLALHGASSAGFVADWIKSILLAWPLVFASILTIAPIINRLLDWLFKAD